MTLAQALERVGKYCLVDLNSHVDVENRPMLAVEFYRAASIVARKTYFLYEMQSTLTLEEDEPEYDTLTDCEKPIFDLDLVHVGGVRLTYYEYSDFLDAFPNFFSASSESTLGAFTQLSPSKIRFAAPPNSTAVALDDTFVTGFALPTPVVYSQETAGTVLQGPDEFQDLSVKMCAVRLSEAYVAGDRGLKRLALYKQDIMEEMLSWYSSNTNKYRAKRKKVGVGLSEDRREFCLGDPF